jgi:uncharacterized protein
MVNRGTYLGCGMGPRKTLPLGLYAAIALGLTAMTVALGPWLLQQLYESPSADERLRMAASSHDAAGVERALREGAAINARDASGITPLSDAARTGNVSLVSSLIAAGADVNTADDSGYTPLMMAATFDHADVVRLLLAHGADPERRSRRGGQTALEQAEQQDASAAAHVLRAETGDGDTYVKQSPLAETASAKLPV